MEVAVGADHGKARFGLADPLDQVGHARRPQQRRVRRRDRRFRLVEPVRHRFVVTQEGAIEGEMHAGRHGAQAHGPRCRSHRRPPRANRPRRRSRAGTSTPGPTPPERSVRGSWTTPRSRPSQTQRTSGAATWLNPASSSPTMRSTSGRGRVLEPREHDQVAAVATVDRRGVVVVPQDGHRPGAGLDAAHRGQQQRGQLRVAQRIGADGETVLVVEQAEGGLFAGAQEMGLVGHAAHSRHHVGPALPHPGDDVDQAGPPGAGAPRPARSSMSPAGGTWRSPSHASTSVRSARSRSAVTPGPAFPREPGRTTRSRTAAG